MTETDKCEKVKQWPGKGAPSCFKRHICPDSMRRAETQPLDVDLSDYGDDFVAGYLAGQRNAMEWLADD